MSSPITSSSDRAWVEECARLFAGLPAYLIGIQCPLEILEAARAPAQGSHTGTGSCQFPLIHKYAVYDLELDTSMLTADECAVRIIDRLKSHRAHSRA